MVKRISVIIPVYNRGYCLPRCLDSVLKQTFTDWECILVNDGSTDNSIDVCMEYAKKDTRFQVVEQLKNEGVSVARNRGLDVAGGEYVAFIDSDDWIESDFLEILYKNVDERTMPVIQNDMEKCNGNVIVNVNLIRNYTFWLNEADGILAFIRTWQFASSVCRLYQRSIIEKYHIRYIPGISWGEDHIFNCTYYQYIEKISFISTRLYHIMCQEGSLTTIAIYNDTYVEASRLIWESFGELVANKKINTPKIEKIINEYYIQYGFAKVIDVFLHKALYPSKHRFYKVIRYMKEIDKEQLKKFLVNHKKRGIIQQSFYCFLFIYWNLYLLTWILLECKFLFDSSKR